MVIVPWTLNAAGTRSRWKADYDQAWLEYQHEIGLRHTRRRKNQTDGAAPEEVEAMHIAWVKAVLLQVILWGQPYVRDGDF